MAWQIKVRLQTHAPLPRVTELYKGLLGPMLNVPFINAIVFASYGIAKRFFESYHEAGDPLSNYEVAAAGPFVCLFVCLFENLFLFLLWLLVCFSFVPSPLFAPLRFQQNIIRLFLSCNVRHQALRFIKREVRASTFVFGVFFEFELKPSSGR